MSICYGSMHEVSEPSLESPRPPMAVSRQGCRETSRERLVSLHPCLLTAIPVCPPRGLPYGRAVALEAAAAHFAAAPSKATALPSWLPAIGVVSKPSPMQRSFRHPTERSFLAFP